jgi:hypothetical protein
MVYAYYAVMGGFAVKIDHLHNTLDQATLTTNALLLLAQHGHFIGLSRELISDKSKANCMYMSNGSLSKDLLTSLDLAKGLVCLQVLWVAGQAIERKLAGFPISLLEFHTLVHIFCALVLYTLWIRKPYDINEPTIVPTEGFPNALAYIVASSRWAGSSGFQKILRPTDSKRNIFFAMFYPNPDPEFIFYRDLGATPQVWFDEIRNIYVPLEMSDDRIRNLIICARYQENTPKPEGCNTTAYVTKAGSTLPEPPFFPGECIQKRYKPANNDQGVLTLSSGQALKSGLGPKEYWELDHADGKLNYGPGISITLSQKDFNRLDMAGTFIQGLIEGRKSESLFQASFSHPQFNDIDSAIFQPFGGGTIRPYGDTMICARQSNWFDFDMTFFNTFGKLSDLYSWILYTLAIVIIPAAYGGIHLGAVHTLFPSEIELTLWKSSCFILLGVAGLPVLGVPGIFAFFEAFRLLDEYMPDAMKPRLRIMRSWIEKYGVAFLSSYVVLSLLAFIVCIVLVPVVLLYVAARLFIVVESFISLRHVPIGVYRTPNTNFTSYIPHL